MISNPEVIKKSQIYWDLWWLKIAQCYASGSKDPSTKVGSIIVSQKRLRSAGYNGFINNMNDDPELYWDRDYKLENCKHAEIAAMDELPDIVYNATLYVYPFAPCSDCAMKIAENAQIKRVVTTDYCPERWRESMIKAKQILIDAKLDYLEYPITQVV